MKRTEVLAILGILSLSSPVLAQGAADERVMIHSLGASQKADFGFADRGIALQKGPLRPMSLRGKTDAMLQNWGLNPRITTRQKSYSGLNLAAGKAIETVDLRFSVDGIPLCQYQIKSHETVGGDMAVFGRMPKLDVNAQYDLANWPADNLVRNIVADTLAQNGIATNFTKNHAEACLWAENGQLYPVWVWEVEADRLNYTVVADDLRSFKFQAKHFHATGKARIYPHNVLDLELQEFTLRSMKETGYLENAYFVTEVDSPFTYATSANSDFTAFGPTSDAFEEISLFTNANRALEWLETMGYKNFGTVPIRIQVHAEFQGDTNNALYQPGATFDTIFVGDGDGTILQNLSTDSDVVGHELGHHVVYHTVTEIAGESLVLHEGLADYFNFARTGNACLGESICPDTAYGNKICYVPKKCLRTGENALKYGGADLPREAHQKSQFISGMLWDLYAKDGIALEDVTHMVLKAIDLLVDDSGYQHFVVGMMLADRALFQGGKCSLIYSRAVERGLAPFLTDITCDSVQSTPAGATAVTDVSGVEKSGSVANTTPTVAGTTSRSSKKSVCGVLMGSSANGQVFSFLLLFILPLIPAMIRRSTRK
ncbi:MAG TPA: hypothetical protein VFO10_27220 [Oligoflexus sp.]|uniref:hypothetical protein n=1 Tax=Oligoflexus sp. TaxID=1971216 RepID=UPI002D7EB02E|nr:hypothetical protein [Oligoflexus sp.]HET9240987.1 hypothetical protein [Oligoflexus sp.]